MHLLRPTIKYFSISGIEVVNINSLGIASEEYTFAGVVVADLLDYSAC